MFFVGAKIKEYTIFIARNSLFLEIVITNQTMIENIRHIIFDLGGVLLNIDYQRTSKAFINLGIQDFDEKYSQLQQTSLFDDFETGKISGEDFIHSLKKSVTAKISEDDIRNAWNAMLLDFPLRRLQILQQLQLHFDTFLLSNTNTIHEEKFNVILKQQTGFTSLGVFFDRVYFSHHIGLRKPDKAAFELILNNHQLSPDKTLFIDDSPQHIESAKTLGIQTVLLEKGMTIEEHIFKPKK